MSQTLTDSEALRQIASNYSANDGGDWLETLQRIAAQLESDAKRYADSEKLQEIGKSAFASIAEMVAALECDYERLQDLADAMLEHNEDQSKFTQLGAWSACYPAEAEELNELQEAAGDCESREDAEQRIMEDSLSLEFRGDWYTSDTEPADAAKPVEFILLLGTGGPATRLLGEISHGEPTHVRLQAQDWGTQWTDYIGADQETLLTYCRCFYFGEG